MIARSIPWRLIAYVVAALIALAALNHAASYVPFTPQWSAKRAVAKAERLEGQVASLERQAGGQAEIAKAETVYHTREVVIRERTAAAISEARSAPDAQTPLSADRADRLRAHDRSLCDDGPCAAVADLARSGAGDVPAPDPAR